jgi:NAD(P)-dependent dehydrogenase (short-subunit alcohol dehydrogenase family)
VVKEINSSGGQAVGISTDLSDDNSVKAAFDQIAQTYPGAGLAAAVFNSNGGFMPKPFLEVTEEEYSTLLDSQAYVSTTQGHFPDVHNHCLLPLELKYADQMHRKGAFTFAQRTLPLLLQAQGLSSHPPTLIFGGATASIRGSANFAALASAKFALRALAQSLAREFGPQGVHVSHTVIDGVIDIPRNKAYTFAREDGKLSPGAVGFSY